MTAHRGGAALLDGYQDFKMHPGEPRGRPVYESVAGGGYDIGQLQEWPLHSTSFGKPFSSGSGPPPVGKRESSGASSGFEMPASDRCR